MEYLDSLQWLARVDENLDRSTYLFELTAGHADLEREDHRRRALDAVETLLEEPTTRPTGLMSGT